MLSAHCILCHKMVFRGNRLLVHVDDIRRLPMRQYGFAVVFD